MQNIPIEQAEAMLRDAGYNPDEFRFVEIRKSWYETDYHWLITSLDSADHNLTMRIYPTGGIVKA